ncbi:MAG: PrsW family intramembrane metalloprotease [Chloroflexota bacterium]|jgi:RsiW-degrading membrane proteinase PrsW (M82 family)|nr:PrsW family intramembrane metalloprotease [Chloroflexota bacterium]MDH5243854.1 PrsW family intramembrane metalloprotease [Chloroflexota bacterium]
MTTAVARPAREAVRSGSIAIVVTIAVLSILGAVGLWNDLSLPLKAVGIQWAALSTAIWLGYGALLLVFFIRPARRAQVLGLGVLLAVAWGGLAATDIAGRANSALEQIAVHASAELDSTWTNVFLAPAVEETIKTLGIILLAFLPAARRFGPAAGLVIGALVGVSFQVVENEIFTLQGMSRTPDAALGVLIETIFVRGVVGVFSHLVYSGAIGAAIGWLLAGPTIGRWRRLAVTVGVFVLMVVLHSWSNWTAHEGEGVLYLVTMGVGLLVLIVTARFALSPTRTASASA